MTTKQRAARTRLFRCDACGKPNVLDMLTLLDQWAYCLGCIDAQRELWAYWSDEERASPSLHAFFEGIRVAAIARAALPSQSARAVMEARR
ncbi:MAG: hypothetical protein IVW53_15355 [Chloroflexi bacterium]|nr:hypothetical protein [Chloroflexota bacterium]